jgi:hypothetical protein
MVTLRSVVPAVDEAEDDDRDRATALRDGMSKSVAHL